jgi:hypothetical protein
MLDKQKFENTVLAVLKARPLMGSLQLRKALVIADALHFQMYGESLTGAEYIKKQYGSVPDTEAFLLLQQMAFSLNAVEVIEVPTGLDFTPPGRYNGCITFRRYETSRLPAAGEA